MIKKILAFAIAIMSVTYSYAQSFNWAIGGGSTGLDYYRAVTTDPQNNVIGLFYFTGNVTIDSAGTPKSFVPSGNRDILIVKYNCNKVFQWAVQVGGANFDGGNAGYSDLIADTSGNIYVASTISGSANFVGAQGNTTSRTSSGTQDGFLMKLSSNGLIQWINLMGGTGNDEATCVALDRNQNPIVGGYHTATAAFQSTSGPSTNRNANSNSQDFFVARYNPAGAITNVGGGASSGADLATNIAIDSAGTVYVVGLFGQGAGFGNGNGFFGANVLVNNGNFGAFLAGMNVNGALQYGVGMGGALEEGMLDVVVDDIRDRVYVAGYFQGTNTLTSRPGGTNQNLVAVGNYDAFVASYTLTGGLQWARHISGASNEYPYGVTLDAFGNVCVTGQINNTTSFGGTNLSASNAPNAFYAKYTPANTLISAVNVTNGVSAVGYALHTSPSGQIYMAGSFSNTLQIPPDSVVSAGNYDGFIARYQDQDTIRLFANKTTLLCTSDTVSFYINNKTQGTFYWYKNDTLVTITTSRLFRAIAGGIYKVVGTHTCAPNTTSNLYTVVQSPLYVAPTISSISVCTGDSARLSASGASIYRWFPSAGLSDTTIANPIVKTTTNATYILLRVTGLCYDLDTINVSVLTNCCLTCATPLTLNQGLVACYPFNGNALDESGNGNNATPVNGPILALDRFNVANRAYQFNGFNQYLEVPNSASLSSPSGNISFTFWARVTAWNFSGGVQYTPILSKSNSAANAQYRAMLRNNGAYAMANGNGWNGVIGTNTNTNTWYFFAITTSNDTMYYYRNGVLLGFAVGPTPYTLNNTTPLRIGRNDVNTQVHFNGRLDEVRVYNRTLTDADVRALYNLSAISGLPTITAGTDKNICKGDSVQLTTTGTTANYLWTPGVYLSSDTARSPFSKADTSLDYVVTVNLSGCKNYDTVRVNVSDFKPDAGTDRSICAGDTVTIEVLNGGNTFTWTPNYNISDPSNDTTRLYPTVDTSYIVASNNGICTRFDTVMISVNTPTLNAGPNVTVCPGDTAKFTVTSNGTVRWSPFIFLSDSIGTNVYALPDSNITYFLEANYLGCTSYDTVSVITANLPVDAGTDKLICKGDSVMLTASGGFTYIWLPSLYINDSSSATPVVNPPMPMYYYVASYNGYCARYDSVFVDVRDAKANAGPDKTICNGDSTTIGISVTGVKTWSPTTGIDTSQISPYAKPTTTTQYILTANNAGCMAYDSVTVTVLDIAVNAGIDRTICKGDTIQLGATGYTKYNWLPAYNISDTGIADPMVWPDATTDYLALVTNGYCIKIDTVKVTVRDLSINAGMDTSVCVGQGVRLKATGAATYQWSPVGTLSNPTIDTPFATPATTTSYIVLGFDGIICQKYDTIIVRVDDYPTVDAGPDLRHCMDDFLDIDADVTNYTRLEWSPATYLSDKLAMKPQVSVKANTTYVLSAWNNYCYASDTMSVSVNPPVDAGFTASPRNGEAPLPVTFTNTSTNAWFFIWDFDDNGASSTSRDAQHTFTAEGRYYVSLLAQDSLGCFDTTTVTIDVIEKEFITMPDAFTPNGDGLNDRFEPVYNPLKFQYVEMKIFNRWGVEIFSTKVPEGAYWDGKVDGNAVEAGVYSYTGLARDIKGKTYELKGSVTVVR